MCVFSKADPHCDCEKDDIIFASGWCGKTVWFCRATCAQWCVISPKRCLDRRTRAPKPVPSPARRRGRSMQASIADEIGRRLTLYARFGALVPDRLRLAVAESIAKPHIPVLLETGLVEECAELLPNGQSRPVPADFEVDLDLLRRA